VIVNDATGVTQRAFSYAVIGAAGFAYAAGVKNTCVDLLTTMSPTDDMLHQSCVDVNLSEIAEGESKLVRWKQYPVYVRHRTAKEIDQALEEERRIEDLRDPETDSERVKDPKWLVVMGACTHLGCLVIPKLGDYDGYFCPCHGAHFDTSGRARKGPALLNLKIPPYKFLNPTTIRIGSLLELPL